MSILNGRGRHGAMLVVAAVVNVALFHPVLAQEASDGVKEVIVTAEKLGRSVMDTPREHRRGAEAGVNATLTPELSIYGSIGLLQAKITDYPGSGFQDNELPMSPSATASLGIAFNRDAAEASFNVRYSGSYYSDI